MGLVVQTTNPLAPWRDRIITEVPHDVIIGDWLDENGVVFTAPTICLRNGEALLRADWDCQLIGNQDVVAFITLPQGGGGGRSGVLQVVMMLAVIVASVYTGGLAAGAFGGVGTTAGATAGALASGVVMAAGNMLISMLIPPTSGLSSLQNNALSAPSPTYSLQAQGNSARLGASIPVIYGLHRVYPDFAAQPYTEFNGNEQYLYQLLCVGQGDYDILDMRIEDSPVASFDEISYTVYGPNQAVSDFPVRVENSGEVAGQELLNTGYVGHFFVNALDTQINQIGIDIIAPAGMYSANDSGGLDARSATFQVEASEFNTTTGLLGPFVVVLTETISAASSTAIRKTYKIAVTAGRYAVRMKRFDAKDESARAGNSIVWAGMRGYIPGNQNYGGITTIAMVMKASNNLSSASSRRVNCKVQRKLKTWNPATGWSAGTVATRSIAWALADIAKADYGLKLRDAQMDLQGFYELEQQYANRTTAFGAANGDYCDMIFDNRVSAWEAMANIAQCGRAMPVLQGALLRVVRDTQQAIPTALFCARNIVKGTFTINYMMPTEATADSVIVEWIDKDSLLPKETQATLPGGSTDNPARVKMPGISSQAHAYREAITLAAVNRYRRKVVTFQTELEGHIPSVGDLIAVSHPMPNWGVSGELVAVGGLDLTLSEPVEFLIGLTYYIALRKPDGSVSGPHLCHAHISGNPDQVTLDVLALDFAPTVTDAKEHTYFAFGPAGEVFFQARVLPPIRPRGNNTVEISCINEHAAVHSAETGTVPALPQPWQLPKKITKPVISRLDVTQAGTATAPVLLLSWSPAANADHYLVQTSIDNANWLTHPDTTSTSYAVPVELGTIWVRVAAVGLARGEWATWTGVTGIIPPPGNVTGLASLEAFIGTQARIVWSAVKRATYYNVEVWAAGVLRRSSAVTTTAYAYSAEDVVRDGGPWRALTFKVKAGNAQGESAASADITLTNPQAGALAGVHVYAGIKSAVITYTRPTDLDFAGVRVCQSLTSGFTPDDSNVVYQDNDAVIVITNLTEGNSYYFRLAAYDSFGKDSLTYTGEYVATISSANAPTPAEIKAGLQEALADPSATPLAFEADVFAVKLAGVDTTPFIIGNIDGVPSILLDANVAVMGNLSATQIRSGRLEATEAITLGNGNAVIDGDGSMIVYDGADTLSNRDFALFTGGNLSFQRYRDGAYHTYKSVRRVEYGTANSGQAVVLPGYWDTQPKVVVSPNAIQSFNAAQSGQSQAWQIRADNLVEIPEVGAVATMTQLALTLIGDAVIDGTAVYRSEAVDAWNRQAYSTVGSSTDCYVRFKFDYTDKFVMVGLTTDPIANNSYDTIDFAIFALTTGHLQIYENSSPRSSNGVAIDYGTFSTSDVFRVERTGTTISYSKNGTVFATASVPANVALFVDSSFYTNGAAISGIELWSLVYPSGSGRWGFDAVAMLTYAANAGTQVVGADSGYPVADVWYGNSATLPINTVSLTASVQFYSNRGDGASTYGYYYRSVIWYVQTYNPGTGVWSNVASKTYALSAAEHGTWVADSLAVNIPAGHTQVRIYFQAYDTNGSTYSAGANAYNYAQNTVASNGASVSVAISGPYNPPFSNGETNATANLTAGSYSPPAGWGVYAVNYSALFNHSDLNNSSYIGHTIGYTNGNYAYHANTNPIYVVNNVSVSTGDLAAGAYNPNFWTVGIMQNGSPWYGTMTLHDPSAVVKIRQLIVNSTEALNSFRFNSFAWNVAGSSAIATGSLNWIAVGD